VQLDLTLNHSNPYMVPCPTAANRLFLDFGPIRPAEGTAPTCPGVTAYATRATESESMNQPAPEGCPSPEPTPKADALFVIGTLADLAPTLKEAELRIYLELARRALYTPTHWVPASSRQLATICKLGRRNAQHALDSLTTRELLTTRQGTATRATVYQVNALSTVRIGGVATTPPPADGWCRDSATLALFRRQGGVIPTPPPTAGLDLTRAPQDPRAVDSDLKPSILDRVLTARPKDFDPELLRKARGWMHGYSAKLGREPYAHPPDDAVCAQFLAVAEPDRLHNLVMELMHERKEPGATPAWFITVALQRLHGVQPTALKQRRAELRAVAGKRPTESAAPPEGYRSTDPQERLFTADLMRQAVAGVKKLR